MIVRQKYLKELADFIFVFYRKEINKSAVDIYCYGSSTIELHSKSAQREFPHYKDWLRLKSLSRKYNFTPFWESKYNEMKEESVRELYKTVDKVFDDLTQTRRHYERNR